MRSWLLGFWGKPQKWSWSYKEQREEKITGRRNIWSCECCSKNQYRWSKGREGTSDRGSTGTVGGKAHNVRTASFLCECPGVIKGSLQKADTIQFVFKTVPCLFPRECVWTERVETGRWSVDCYSSPPGRGFGFIKERGCFVWAPLLWFSYAACEKEK